ncbi:MAG: hypothetical protein HC819_07505 [Cyclobacteriaceae bacterium]|nr:hypothetical protein [Cyclobacteriaceae bacterium]
MKKEIKIFYLLYLIGIILISSCKDDETDAFAYISRGSINGTIETRIKNKEYKENLDFPYSLWNESFFLEIDKEKHDTVNIEVFKTADPLVMESFLQIGFYYSIKENEVVISPLRTYGRIRFTKKMADNTILLVETNQPYGISRDVQLEVRNITLDGQTLSLILLLSFLLI